MKLDEFNALDEESATREFLRCCGSTRWAREMAAVRPFESAEMMMASADATWARLERQDYLEAFAAHPRIGESRGSGAWSQQEQSGMASADQDARERLAQLNREYEARFGYIFIICATGRSAAEMAAALERRLHNAPADELRIAAEEQRTITRLRLEKLLS
jgi:2-oxo-4-hydroxy-4-carboxy-5-ureidoimidazoline decarboxylase